MTMEIAAYSASIGERSETTVSPTRYRLPPVALIQIASRPIAIAAASATRALAGSLGWSRWTGSADMCSPIMVQSPRRIPSVRSSTAIRRRSSRPNPAPSDRASTGDMSSIDTAGTGAATMQPYGAASKSAIARVALQRRRTCCQKRSRPTP